MPSALGSGISPKSKTVTVCGEESRLIARASRTKRALAIASTARSLRRILMATSRPITSCRARYTVPIDPAPSLPRMTKRPATVAPRKGSPSAARSAS